MSEGLVLAGRYRLVKQLGAGGMGSVWKAEDLTLGAEVAIKLIDPAFAESAEALARFRREAQSAASIRSTYVVQILDHGIDRNTPYIAMELLNGESLAQRLETQHKLKPDFVARILGQVGRALSLAHEHGIVHRDMKPENIFLVREDEEDVGKVLDFGIARTKGGLTERSDLKTSTGALLGTPYYMSPEQATGQPVDHLTDIWSFGAIAFECITGRKPFDGESLGALFHAVCMAELPVPSRTTVVPVGFDGWFARTVCRDKTARFQSIKEAADALRAICASSQLVGQPTDVAYATTKVVDAQSFEMTAPPAFHTIATIRKPGPLSLLLVGIPGALVIVAGAYIGWRQLHPDPPPLASVVAAPPPPNAGATMAGQPIPSAEIASPVVSVSQPASLQVPASAAAPLASDRAGSSSIAERRQAPSPSMPRSASTKAQLGRQPAKPASPDASRTPKNAGASPNHAPAQDNNAAGI